MVKITISNKCRMSVIVASPIASCQKIQKRISGTSCHCSSTPVVLIDLHGMTSYLYSIATLGQDGTVFEL